MRCDEVGLLLDEAVDGALEGCVTAGVAEHLSGCPACRRREAALRDLQARVRELPREVSPGRDLWAGVEAAILAERRGAPAPPSRPAGGWGRLALAAAALLVVAGGALVVGMRLGSSGDPVRRSGAGSGAVLAATGSLEGASLAYEQARDQLLAIVHARRDSLDPATAAVVERDLEVIDRAVAEIREALAASPGDEALGRMLLGTYRRELDLLQQVTRLPGRA